MLYNAADGFASFFALIKVSKKTLNCSFDNLVVLRGSSRDEARFYAD